MVAGRTVLVPMSYVESAAGMIFPPNDIFSFKRIIPVVEPPRVNVLFLNDWIVALLPVSERPLPAPPPNVADIVAVGVPSLIPVTANSAVEVAVEPRRKSRVDASLGKIAPAVIFQLVPPLPTQDPQEGDPAPWEMKHSPRLPAVV